MSGKIIWQDLTVENADQIRDFYSAVVGWTWRPENMGGYDDYSMMPTGSDEPIAGVCHARSSNSNLPPHWLIYVEVEDVAIAVSTVKKLGGEVIDGPRKMGSGEFCVIRDPAGAMIALITG